MKYHQIGSELLVQLDFASLDSNMQFSSAKKAKPQWKQTQFNFSVAFEGIWLSP